MWDWDSNGSGNHPVCSGSYSDFSGDPDGGTASSTSHYTPGSGGRCFLVKVKAYNAFGSASQDMSNIVQVN